MTSDRKFAILRREKFVLAMLDALTNPEWGISNVDRDHFRMVTAYFGDMTAGLADRLKTFLTLVRMTFALRSPNSRSN